MGLNAVHVVSENGSRWKLSRFCNASRDLFIYLSGVLHPMLFSTVVSLLPALVAAHSHIILNDQSTIADNSLNVIKVPVQLGVMSRCPDALLCEATFNDVLAQVWDKVDLSLVYIAK